MEIDYEENIFFKEEEVMYITIRKGKSMVTGGLEYDSPCVLNYLEQMLEVLKKNADKTN